MKLRDLSYLLAVAKTLHFGKAAALAHVSQPTLSVQLKKLEDRLGVVLIERDNKNVRLTPEGKIIAEIAQRIVQDAEAIKAYAKTVQDPHAGDLQFGIIPTLGPYLLPNMIPVLHEKFPKLSLWLHEATTEVLLEKIHNGQLDLAILALPIESENLTIIPLFSESFYFAVHKEHKLAKRKTIALADIQNENILLLTDGHCLRDQALAVCHNVHIKPKSDFKATSLETLRQMVAQGLGATLMPKLAIETANPNICYIPFAKPAPQRQLGLVFRKTHVRNKLLTQIAEKLSASF
jgi:LysR family transcriptional regulator, hydrogen peroxide-inducible genes activator